MVQGYDFKKMGEYVNICTDYIERLEGTGAYGPLLLAPAEGLGGPSGPLVCGGIYFNN